MVEFSLHDVRVCTKTEAVSLVLLTIAGRDEYDGYVGKTPIRFDLFQQCEAVHSRHFDIRNNQSELLLSKLSKCLNTVSCEAYVETLSFKNAFFQCSRRERVIHDQHATGLNL